MSDFEDNTPYKKCINIFKNGDFEHGKTLYVEPHWTFQDLLNASSQRLNLGSIATRMFTVDGVDIDDCMMLEDSDIVFLAEHHDQEFIKNTASTDDNDMGDKTISQHVATYRVGSFLGKGGFGEVRIGEHQLTGDKVALKFLRKADIATIGAAERTAVEIQCLSALKHSNIIRLEQHIDSPAHVVLVFELMEGGDLHKYLNSRGSTPQEMALSEDEARPLFHQLLSAISYAHNQHICHRDLKLENILLKGKEDLNEVKIADFGLSDFYRPGAMMKSNCGTLSFLAPEVFRGTSNAGPPLDVWSLGVILFAVLCGRLPFEVTANESVKSSQKRPREQIIRSRIMKCQYKIDDNIGPEAKDLVRRMLKLDPSERASIPELLGHCWLRTGIGEFGSNSGSSSSSKIGGSIFGGNRSRTSSINEGKGDDTGNNRNNSSDQQIDKTDEQLDSIRELSRELESKKVERGRSRSPYTDITSQVGLNSSSGGRASRSNSNTMVEPITIDDMDDDGFKDSVTNSSNSLNSPEVGASGSFKLVPLRRRSSVAGSEIAGSSSITEKTVRPSSGKLPVSGLESHSENNEAAVSAKTHEVSSMKVLTREAWDEKSSSVNNIGSPSASADGRLKKAGAFSLRKLGS